MPLQSSTASRWSSALPRQVGPGGLRRLVDWAVSVPRPRALTATWPMRPRGCEMACASAASTSCAARADARLPAQGLRSASGAVRTHGVRMTGGAFCVMGGRAPNAASTRGMVQTSLAWSKRSAQHASSWTSTALSAPLVVVAPSEASRALMRSYSAFAPRWRGVCTLSPAMRTSTTFAPSWRAWACPPFPCIVCQGHGPRQTSSATHNGSIAPQ